MSRTISTVVCLVTLGFFAATSLPAKDKQVAQEPPIRSGQAAIEKTLQEPIDLKFVEAPLLDVIDFLKKKSKVEIVLDTQCLADVGISGDTPVTVDLHTLPLRSALNLMLRPLKLAWTIHNDVLFITTPEEAEALLTTKVLDVSDLVLCKDSRGELWDDYDSLIDTITATTMQTTWDQVGGPGSVAPANFGTAKAIVVRQTYEVHYQLAELLESIRAIAKKNPDAGPPQRDRPKPEAKQNGGCFSGGFF